MTTGRAKPSPANAAHDPGPSGGGHGAGAGPYASAPGHPALPDSRPVGLAPDHADLFERAPVGYVVIDADGRIETINVTGAAMLGWDRDWLLGRPFCRWIIDEDRERFEAHHAQALERARRVDHELRIKNRHGRVIRLRLTSAGEAYGPEEPAACRTIMIDISDESEAARRLRRLQSRLVRIARLNTAGELASSLAHDLNQPLATVVLNCETALQLVSTGRSGPYELTEALGQATQAASYASEIVQQLRGFLNGEGDDRQVCTVPGLVDDVFRLLQIEAADCGIDFRLELERNLPAVRVTAAQIGQALVNLVRNSFEAMGGSTAGVGSRVTIHAVHDRPDRIRLTVEDTGPGIEKTAREDVFRPFFTTKDEGMGMGLAITRRIVDRHGGELWITTSPHGGAAIHFTLPVCRDESDDA